MKNPGLDLKLFQKFGKSQSNADKIDYSLKCDVTTDKPVGKNKLNLYLYSTLCSGIKSNEPNI